MREKIRNIAVVLFLIANTILLVHASFPNFELTSCCHDADNQFTQHVHYSPDHAHFDIHGDKRHNHTHSHDGGKCSLNLDVDLFSKDSDSKLSFVLENFSIDIFHGCYGCCHADHVYNTFLEGFAWIFQPYIDPFVDFDPSSAAALRAPPVA